MIPGTGTTRTFPAHLASVVELLEALAGTQPAPAPTTAPDLPGLIGRLDALTPPTPAPTTARPAAPATPGRVHAHRRAAHRRVSTAEQSRGAHS